MYARSLSCADAVGPTAISGLKTPLRCSSVNGSVDEGVGRPRAGQSGIVRVLPGRGREIPPVQQLVAERDAERRTGLLDHSGLAERPQRLGTRLLEVDAIGSSLSRSGGVPMAAQRPRHVPPPRSSAASGACGSSASRRPTRRTTSGRAASMRALPPWSRSTRSRASVEIKQVDVHRILLTIVPLLIPRSAQRMRRLRRGRENLTREPRPHSRRPGGRRTCCPRWRARWRSRRSTRRPSCARRRTAPRWRRPSGRAPRRPPWSPARPG